jgi:hypothetical protein
MITLKLHTPHEGGKWTRTPGEITKANFMRFIDSGHPSMIIDNENNYIDWYSLMFSDGTIYDKDKGFRPEKYFPKDETIEYMNKILNRKI